MLIAKRPGKTIATNEKGDQMAALVLVFDVCYLPRSHHPS